MLKDAFDADVELVPGSGGIFDVLVDNGLEYSKHQTGTFPDEAALIQKLREKRQPIA